MYTVDACQQLTQLQKYITFIFYYLQIFHNLKIVSWHLMKEGCVVWIFLPQKYSKSFFIDPSSKTKVLGLSIFSLVTFNSNMTVQISCIYINYSFL